MYLRGKTWKEEPVFINKDYIMCVYDFNTPTPKCKMTNDDVFYLDPNDVKLHWASNTNLD